MDNDNKNNDFIKQASKTAINAALSPIKKSILLSILPIIPYIVGAFLIVILFCGIYMSIDEQADTVANDFGQKVGNAIQLYGFKTETEVEASEEVRFYNTLKLYKSFYNLTDYDITLISNTLLFEGMYEDKLEFVEDASDETIPVLDKDGNVIVKFFDMINSIYKSFYSGFSSAFMSSSQYKKANKILSEPIIVIKKCRLLTDSSNEVTEDFKQCYRGYLVAEYDEVVDQLIESDKIETEVKPGYLILDDIFNLKDMDIDMNEEIQDTLFNLNNIFFKFNPVAWLLNSISIHLGVEFKAFNDQLRTAVTILIFGKLASPSLDRAWWNNKHFFYDGYIVKYLREYYKVSKDNYSVDNLNDIYIDRKNKLEIANLIIETTDAYTDGDNEFKNNNSSLGGNITGSNETNASVIIDNDTSISFDDYVLLYLLKNYQDKIFEIINSGVNVEERLKALIIFARTKVYKETGFDNNSVDVNGDKDIYDAGMEIYNDLINSEFSEYLNNIKNIIKGTHGKKLKLDGKILDINEEDVLKILSEMVNGSTFEDAIKKIIPGVSLNSTYFPLPEGSYHKTSDYGEMRGDGPHKAYDYGAVTGTPIYSISDGVVIDVVTWCEVGNKSCGGGFGNRVYVAYTNGDGHTYYVIYGHMNDVGISVGSTISAGTLLGHVGNTGYSSGSHLHLEVRKDSTNNDSYSINPNTIFDINFN